MLSWRWAPPSSEARKTKADKKMDEMSPEGLRGLVEFTLFKAALNSRLPAWPRSSIPLCLMGSPRGLGAGSQMGSFHPPRAKRRKQGLSTIWECAHGWSPCVNCPSLGKTALQALPSSTYWCKMSFLLWNDQDDRVVSLLKYAPTCFCFSSVAHETPKLEHNTPLLPTHCFSGAEAVRNFPD